MNQSDAPSFEVEEVSETTRKEHEKKAIKKPTSLVPYHILPVAEVMARFGTSVSGLKEVDIRERRGRFGWNELKGEGKVT
jgi:hypothetical protein